MSSGKTILKTFKNKWQLMQAFEMFLYASGPAVLVYFLTSNIIVTLLIFSGILVVGFAIKKPWQLTLEKIGNYIDSNVDAVQYSTGLLLVPENQLSSLASLQRHKVSKILKNSIASLKPNVSFKKPALILGLFLLLSVLAQQFNWASKFDKSVRNPEMQETIAFKPLDSVNTKNEPPRIKNQILQIRYPSYTSIGTIHSKTMNIKALEGSRLSWQLQFDKPIEEAVFESSDENFSMRKSEKGYTHQMLLNAQGFYNFKFDAVDGETYQSELYALEMFKDESPVVEIQQLQQFTSLDFEEDKNIEFETVITDDFGIAEAYIIATVSKGEGESVKFREERLKFENEVLKGSKNQKLSKRMI